MPKFKLKNILNRVILGESWRERVSSDYLCAELELSALESRSLEHFGSASDNEVEENDRYSINSFSTTATASNLPGAGRTVDTYIYQPMGRRIERIARHLRSLSSHNRTCSENIGDAVSRYSAATAADTDDIGDSVNSLNSFSTMETVDNQPGTGRFIDTYIFQPMGRRIERLAMRYTIASLHPARIAQYLEADKISLDPSHYTPWTLHDAIALLCSWTPRGSTIVAGMKGLVKQTQYAPKASSRKEEIHSTFLGQTQSTNPHLLSQHSFVCPCMHTVARSTSTFLASSPYYNWKHSLVRFLVHIQTRNGFSL